MSINRRAAISAAAVSLFGFTLLPGCGGGSGLTTSSDSYGLSSRTRALQVGDTWQYAVSTVSGTGSLYRSTKTVSVGLFPLSGVPTLARTIREDFNGNAAYEVQYLAQDDNGDVVALGQKGAAGSIAAPDSPERDERRLTVPQRILFGSWTPGATLAYTLEYQDEPPIPSKAGESLEVLGTEKVHTRVGTFDTWKVRVTPLDTTYGLTGTYWYAPQLGNFIRAEYAVSGFEVYDRVTMTLIKTNVPMVTTKLAP